MTATEEASFHAALDAQLEDDCTRMVFADWLEERDDPRALGYRLLVAFRLRPFNGHHELKRWGAYSWSCCFAGRPYSSTLTRTWYNHLTKIERPTEVGPPGKILLDARYPTRREAEDDAALAVSLMMPVWQAKLIREARL